MASYPGTVKVFTRKVDLADTVFAENVNALQDEIVAIEQALGLTPQAGFASVAARLAAFEANYLKVSDSSPATVGGDKTFTGLVEFSGRIRVTTNYVMTGLDSTDHGVQIGTTDEPNLAFDGARIQARDNGAAADLTLNPFGGNVRVGGNRVLTQADAGPGNNLNADLLDGQHASEFSPSGHKHAQNFAQVYRTTTLSVPNGVDESDWHDVIFNGTTVHVKESGADMYNLASGRFYTPPQVGPALYYFGVRLAYNRDSNVGDRRLRFVDSNGVIFDMMAEEADLMSKDFVSLSGMYYFPGTAGFYVKAQTFQNSGSTRTIYANSTTRPFVATWAVVARTLS